VRRDLEGGYVSCTELVNAVICMRFKLGACEYNVYYIQKYPFFTRDVCFALSFAIVRCIVSETFGLRIHITRKNFIALACELL